MAKVRKAELSFLYATRRLILFYISAKYHWNLAKGIPVTEQKRNLLQTKQWEITPKVRKAELSFLYATRHLVLFYISTKYHKNIPKGLWLTERTQYQWIITGKYNKGRQPKSKNGSVVWSCSTFLPSTIEIFQRVFKLQRGHEIFFK